MGAACLACYILVAVHLTLAQRVLHPSTPNVNVRILYVPMLKEGKKVVYSWNTQRLYYISSITEVPGEVQASIYGLLLEP